MDNKKLFYISGKLLMGNAMYWMRQGESGYSIDVREAGKFSENDVKRICIAGSGLIPYLCSVIDNNKEARKVIIDKQFVHEFDEYRV